MNNELVEQNMNLVYFIINKDYPTYRYDEDIVQSGMLGLCKAADKYDASRGKFSTYAGRCIRNEINREFIRRKPHQNLISLDANIGEDSTLGDVVMGDDNIVYIDDKTFCNQLSDEEKSVLKLDGSGYGVDEIAFMINSTNTKVRKLLRLIRLKWRTFNGNQG
jgi:RNA polymerase sporulation-specific sigma factor